MDDRQRADIVRRAHQPNRLSSNDVHELKSIMRSGLKPYADDLRNIMNRASSNDEAALLKAALLGESSLSGNERFRLNEAILKHGKRVPG